MAANTQVRLFANYTRDDSTSWFRTSGSRVQLSINLEIISPRRRKHKKQKANVRQSRLLQKGRAQNNISASKPGRLHKALKIAGLARYAAKQLKGIL